ncbi:unnamed protein product [Rhizophagus irregularis]|nr:unnamed protein product [Rhizophagus irregularis]
MIKVIYKIHEKNASRYIEKETCMGLFSEDTQLESVFTQWWAQCDNRRRICTDAYLFAYDVVAKKQSGDEHDEYLSDVIDP